MATVFKAMLHFIYTDELPPDGVIAEEMLAAACRFRLERMKRLCENLLAEHVTTVSMARLPGAGRVLRRIHVVAACRQGCHGSLPKPLPEWTIERLASSLIRTRLYILTV